MSKRNETEQLERRLASLGGKIRLQYLVEGFFRVVGIFLLGLVAFYLIDYLTRVPFEIRLVALVSGLAYGLYWFNKKFVSKYRKTLSTEEVSLLVERANPDLKSRMISTLQFEERGVNQGTSKQLVDGLIGQTFEMVKTVSWGSVIDKTWIKPTMKVLLVAICLVVLSVAVSSEHFLIYLKRFVSSTARYPTKTMIVDVNFVNVTKGDIYRIPEGEKIVIEVKAEGVLPVVGKVSIYASSGSESDFDLVQDQNEPSLYRVSLDPILEKVKIEIFLGDCEWGPVSVDIIPRPTITNIKAVVKSPAYTEIGVQTLDTGNLQIIEGSEVEFEVTTDKKCKSFEMYIVNGDVKPASFTKKSDYVWSTNLHVSQSFKYSFQLIDDGDLNSINVPVYTVSVKQDMSPVVQVFKPSSSSEAAPISKIPFLFDVKDDFKVQTIRVRV